MAQSVNRCDTNPGSPFHSYWDPMIYMNPSVWESLSQEDRDVVLAGHDAFQEPVGEPTRPGNGVRVKVVRRCPQVERAHTQKG
jgi:hypothetical protein